MILTNYLLGFIEDNAGLFSIPRLISGLAGCTDYVGYPTGLCQNLLTSNQPFMVIPAFLLAQMLHPVLAYNLIVLGGAALNFLFAFGFFKKLFGRFVAVLLATIFLFSPYLSYQSRSHFDLIQFWPVIWFLETLFFSKSRHKAVFLGLLLTLITGISNYLGYFTTLFTSIYLTFNFMVSAGKLSALKKNYPDVVKSAAVFALSSLLFMAPYIRSNYFSPKARIEESADSKAVNRPFEDFVTFSSRPWYYLLPSVDNPFFGGLSQNALDRFSNGGNYLTQNYFKAEHSASYLGWTNLILLAVGLAGRVLCRPTDGQESGTHPEDGKHPPTPQTAAESASPPNLPALLITVIGLTILTMPPAITVNGGTIYTPSYILFKVFPMFRVLARMGVLILFLTLIFTGHGYLALIKLWITKKMSRRVVRSVLLILVLFSIAEFFIPLKITHIGTPPKIYTYIGTTDSLKSPITVYPYNKTNEALFWMTTYSQPLINPRTYENKGTNFAASDFTKLLNTTNGLEKARYMGAKYLVYFYADDKRESADFFATTPLLTRIDELKEGNLGEERIIYKPIDPIYLTFVRIAEAGSAVSNSAILYKFR